MIDLLRAMIGILFQRLGPEHLPDSRFLLQLMIGVYVLVNAVAAMIGQLDPISSIGIVIVNTVLIAVVVYGVLSFARRPGRFNQTATAVYGVLSILQVITIPIIVLASIAQENSPLYIVLGLSIWVVVVWQVIVVGHIVRRATDQPYVIGIAIALGYMLLSIAVTSLIIPISGT